MHRVIGWATVVLLLSSCSRLYIGHPPVGSEPPIEQQAVIYVLGDFGVDNDSFRRIAQAVKKDVATDDNEPILLTTGDNLYESGLPTRGSTTGARAVTRLRSIAQELDDVRHDGRAVDLLLVPGNHDYAGDALDPNRRAGDITRWYFLDELRIDETANWRMLPGGSTAEVNGSDDLYRRIYRNGDVPRALSAFMTPLAVSLGDGAVTLIAIDSELVIELYQVQPRLADEYLAELERRLREHADTWTIVVAHHPLVTGGAHRPGVPLRFILGPGWPQYPAWWHKAFIWAGPPITLVRWVLRSRQDVHNGANRQYRERLYEVMRDAGGDLLLAGHDHNTQMIDLSEHFEPGGPNHSGLPLQLLTGEVAKVDPVTKERGTLFYHADGGYVRLVADDFRMQLELKDRSGTVLNIYRIRRPDSP